MYILDSNLWPSRALKLTIWTFLEPETTPYRIGPYLFISAWFRWYWRIEEYHFFLPPTLGCFSSTFSIPMLDYRRITMVSPWRSARISTVPRPHCAREARSGRELHRCRSDLGDSEVCTTLHCLTRCHAPKNNVPYDNPNLHAKHEIPENKNTRIHTYIHPYIHAYIHT